MRPAGADRRRRSSGVPADRSARSVTRRCLGVLGDAARRAAPAASRRWAAAWARAVLGGGLGARLGLGLGRPAASAASAAAARGGRVPVCARGLGQGGLRGQPRAAAAASRPACCGVRQVAARFAPAGAPLGRSGRARALPPRRSAPARRDGAPARCGHRFGLAQGRQRGGGFGGMRAARGGGLGRGCHRGVPCGSQRRAAAARGLLRPGRAGSPAVPPRPRGSRRRYCDSGWPAAPGASAPPTASRAGRANPRRAPGSPRRRAASAPPRAGGRAGR